MLAQAGGHAAFHPEEYRRRAADLVEQIEAKARQERGSSTEEIRPLDPKHPHERPARLKKSPAPAFHAASRDMRTYLCELYNAFVAEFRQAAEKLTLGDRLAVFPPGSFSPYLPFESDPEGVLLLAEGIS